MTEPARAGLHHLELWTADLALAEPSWDWLLTALGWSAEHGWSELFGAAYPHAGGTDHVAWYGENAKGFEVEVVAPARAAD